MLLSKIRLAWAAGLFNGEGCTTYNKRVNSYQCCILIGQADCNNIGDGRWVLDKFKSCVGNIGTVNGPYAKKNINHNCYYQYSANTFEGVQAIIAMMWKWLSPVKKEQAKKILDNYMQYVKENPSLTNGGNICKRKHNILITGYYNHILGEKIYRQCKECVKQFMVGRYVKQLDRVINKEESCV